MNRSGQVDIMDIFKAIIAILLIVILGFGVIIPTINNAFAPKTCPACDCSAYQNNLSSCSNLVTNLTKELNETPVKYVNVTIEKEVPVDRPIKQDTPITVSILIISLGLWVYATIKLFKIKIKLPEWLENRLKKIENIIVTVKWIHVVITILSLLVVIVIFIRLVMRLF